MNESNIQLAVKHALEWHDYEAIHIPRNTHFVSGFPDLAAEHPVFPAARIEVKAVLRNDLVFSFDQVSPEQYERQESWMKRGGLTFIAIGKIMPAGTKTSLGGIMVFPWWRLLELKEKYGKSIPWDWTLYTRKPKEYAPEDCLIEEIKPEWWISKESGDWRFPITHPLAKPPMVEVPFYKRKRARQEHDDIVH